MDMLKNTLKTSSSLFEWSLINKNDDSNSKDELKIIDNSDNHTDSDSSSNNNNSDIDDVEPKTCLNTIYDNNIDYNIITSKLDMLENISNNINSVFTKINSIYLTLEDLEVKVNNIEETIKNNRNIILDKESSYTLKEISKNLIDITSLNSSTNESMMDISPDNYEPSVDKYHSNITYNIDNIDNIDNKEQEKCGSLFTPQINKPELPRFNLPNTHSSAQFGHQVNTIPFHKNTHPNFYNFNNRPF